MTTQSEQPAASLEPAQHEDPPALSHHQAAMGYFAAVSASGLGVATGTVAFFRSVGGPRAPDALPLSLRDGFVQAFPHALTATFRYAVPCILVAFLITWFHREQPLRGAARAGDPGRELAGRGAADGS